MWSRLSHHVAQCDTTFDKTDHSIKSAMSGNFGLKLSGKIKAFLETFFGNPRLSFRPAWPQTFFQVNLYSKFLRIFVKIIWYNKQIQVCNISIYLYSFSNRNLNFVSAKSKIGNRETLRGNSRNTRGNCRSTGETCGNTMGNGKKWLGNWGSIISRESPL